MRPQSTVPSGTASSWSTHKKFKIFTHRLFEYAIVVFTGLLMWAFVTMARIGLSRRWVAGKSRIA